MVNIMHNVDNGNIQSIVGASLRYFKMLAITFSAGYRILIHFICTVSQITMNYIHTCRTLGL